MHNDNLKSLFETLHDGSAERTSACPTDDQFAAFVDGGLPVVDHERLCAHFADCICCRERLGMIGRAREAEDPLQPSELLLARAARMAPSGRGRKPSSYRWAAAASAVLALTLVLSHTPDRPPGGIELTEPGGDVRITRSISTNATVHPGRLTLHQRDGAFHWPSVPDSLYYEIRIVSDEGDLIWQERARETRWALPDGLELERGREYFVRLDAYLSESKILNSDYVGFRVGGSR